MAQWGRRGTPWARRWPLCLATNDLLGSNDRWGCDDYGPINRGTDGIHRRHPLVDAWGRLEAACVGASIRLTAGSRLLVAVALRGVAAATDNGSSVGICWRGGHALHDAAAQRHRCCKQQYDASAAQICGNRRHGPPAYDRAGAGASMCWWIKGLHQVNGAVRVLFPVTACQKDPRWGRP